MIGNERRAVDHEVAWREERLAGKDEMLVRTS
jgi:hypothetical protein